MRKAIAVADTHLGANTHSITDPDTGLPSRLIDVHRTWMGIVDHAIAIKVPLFIFAGDCFHSNRPSPTEYVMAASIFQKLESAGIPTIAIDGNHDYVLGKGKASALSWIGEEFNWQYVRFIGHVCEMTLLHLDVQLLLVPHCSDEMEQIQSVLQSPRTAEKRLLVCHTTFEGAVVGSEQYMLASRVKPIPQDADVDLVLSGHIHKPQRLVHAYGKTVDIVYPGSIEKVDFGERDEIKEFGVIDFDNMSYQSNPLNTRQLIQVEAEASTTAELQEKLPTSGLQGAIVKAVIKAEKNAPISRHDVEELLWNQGVHNVSSVQINRSKDETSIEEIKQQQETDDEMLAELIHSSFTDEGDRARAWQIVQEITK